MLIRTVAAAVLASILIPAQEPVEPKKPGGSVTVVDPAKNPPAGFNQAQWNQAINLGTHTGRYSARLRGAALPDAGVIRAGLEWLKACQQQDGSWRVNDDANTTTALTSLAILAMLGDGSTLRVGPFKSPVKKGVNWLRQLQQKRATGAFADATGPHMLATLAMTESYMLSDYKLIKKNAVQGLTHLETLRHEDGGWRASPTEESSDAALTVWGASLLGTAADASLIAPHESHVLLASWLAGPQANAAPDSGMLGRSPPATRQAELVFDQGAANAFTSFWVAAGCNKQQRFMLSVQRAEALVRAAGQARAWSKKHGRKLSIYEWFCSSHALMQSGDTKAVAKITKALAEAQHQEGEHKGSWDPVGAWGAIGGRIWTTAMAALTLEAPYRYAKFDAKPPGKKEGR